MITKITFWCQKVLPVEFDDSLSYYETLCKVVEKLNEVVDTTNKAFNQLETDINAELNNKQDTLVSGTNIKTVNGQSVLGSGNIDAGGTDVEGNPTGAVTDGDLSKIKIGSKVYSIHNYTDAINNKQDTLVSGTNIKTVNGQSILGSGNIDAGGTDVEGNPTGAVTDGDLNKIKIGSNVYSIHDYTSELNNKRDKIILNDGILGLYAVSGKNQRVLYPASKPAGATVPLFTPISVKDASGHKTERIILRSETPPEGYNKTDIKYLQSVVNHEEFDSKINKKQDTLVSGENIKTVNGQSVLGSGNIEAGGTNVEGNPTGAVTDGDLSKIKVGSKIYSIHDYTNAINGKLDKVTDTSGYPQAYAKNTNGEQTMLDITPVAASNTIIYRDGNGYANIATPTQPNHIANKRYVDNAISGKQDTLVSGTNIKTVNGQTILGSGNISIEGGSGSNPFSSAWTFLGIMTANNAGTANFDIANVLQKTIQVYIRVRAYPYNTYSTIIYCSGDAHSGGGNSYNMPYSNDATYNLNVFVTNYADSEGENAYSTLKVVRTSPFTSQECEIYYRILG